MDAVDGNNLIQPFPRTYSRHGSRNILIKIISIKEVSIVLCRLKILTGSHEFTCHKRAVNKSANLKYCFLTERHHVRERRLSFLDKLPRFIALNRGEDLKLYCSAISTLGYVCQW